MARIKSPFNVFIFLALFGVLAIASLSGFVTGSIVHGLWMHRLWCIAQFGTVNAADCDSWFLDRLVAMRITLGPSEEIWSGESWIGSYVGRADLVIWSVLWGVWETETAAWIIVGGIISLIIGSLSYVVFVRWRGLASLRFRWADVLRLRPSSLVLGVTITCAYFIGVIGWYLSAHSDGRAQSILVVGEVRDGIWFICVSLVVLGTWLCRAACWSSAGAGRLDDGGGRMCGRCFYHLLPAARIQSSEDSAALRACPRCPECGLICNYADQGVHTLPFLQREIAVIMLVFTFGVAAAALLPRDIIGRAAWSWIRLRSTSYIGDDSIVNIPFGVPAAIRFGNEQVIIVAVFLGAQNSNALFRGMDDAHIVVFSSDARVHVMTLKIGGKTPLPLSNRTVQVHSCFGDNPWNKRGSFINFRLTHQPDEFKRVDLDASVQALWPTTLQSLEDHLIASHQRLLVPVPDIGRVSRLWER